MSVTARSTVTVAMTIEARLAGIDLHAIPSSLSAVTCDADATRWAAVHDVGNLASVAGVSPPADITRQTITSLVGQITQTLDVTSQQAIRSIADHHAAAGATVEVSSHGHGHAATIVTGDQIAVVMAADGEVVTTLAGYIDGTCADITRSLHHQIGGDPAIGPQHLDESGGSLMAALTAQRTPGERLVDTAARHAALQRPRTTLTAQATVHLDTTSQIEVR